VDSELTLLYQKLKGSKFVRKGTVNNPFFGKADAPFRHPNYPIYLVTRLAAYDWNDVKGMIDRSLAARNRGRFVLDLQILPGRTRQRLAAQRGHSAAYRPHHHRRKPRACSTARRT
jgi:uncharacterized protein (TIGR03790 family)